jgi:hypothetical protein
MVPWPLSKPLRERLFTPYDIEVPLKLYHDIRAMAFSTHIDNLRRHDIVMGVCRDMNMSAFEAGDLVDQIIMESYGEQSAEFLATKDRSLLPFLGIALCLCVLLFFCLAPINPLD